MAQTYQRIASTRLGTDASTVTFSGISSAYTDLEILISARSTAAADYAEMFMRFNGDTANNYAYVSLRGLTTSTAAYDGTNSAGTAGVMFVPGANRTAGGFGHARVYIVDYKDSTTHKSGSYLDHVASNLSSGYLHSTGAFYWSGTAAINSIQFSGTTFAANSLFQIYAIARA
jgi:hypothetical protein